MNEDLHTSKLKDNLSKSTDGWEACEALLRSAIAQEISNFRHLVAACGSKITLDEFLKEIEEEILSA